MGVQIFLNISLENSSFHNEDDGLVRFSNSLVYSNNLEYFNE